LNNGGLKIFLSLNFERGLCVLEGTRGARVRVFVPVIIYLYIIELMIGKTDKDSLVMKSGGV
jgi:hypothetical protein